VLSTRARLERVEPDAILRDIMRRVAVPVKMDRAS
jgi:hypothetical protein